RNEARNRRVRQYRNRGGRVIDGKNKRTRSRLRSVGRRYGIGLNRRERCARKLRQRKHGIKRKRSAINTFFGARRAFFALSPCLGSIRSVRTTNGSAAMVEIRGRKRSRNGRMERGQSPIYHARASI